jgi:phosphopantetheinyl transferase (holo-ACP synthase)
LYIFLFLFMLVLGLDVATELGITSFLISISYSGGFAIASVIALGD